ncbi:MAG: methyltransferase [Candidatus Erginobacter occultus]|nr:methyltransferase [Candidatus Erginobacter occultus]
MVGNRTGEIEREKSVQGRAWDSVHFGYFSDPETAAVLVDTVVRQSAKSRPQTIVDLGGGTGFILSELARKGLDPGINLVNLDLSPAQLAAVRLPGVRRVEGAIGNFRREDLAAGTGAILFVMRSVLHYPGPEGLGPALRHIRSQMRRGEYFIHQTACFDNKPAAECLNAIYAALKTGKRYPATATLLGRMEEAGFAVDGQLTAPALALTAAALGERYDRSPAGMEKIGRKVIEKYGGRPGVFKTGESGWTAYLHYRVFLTRAD